MFLDSLLLKFLDFGLAGRQVLKLFNAQVVSVHLITILNNAHTHTEIFMHMQKHSGTQKSIVFPGVLKVLN